MADNSTLPVSVGTEVFANDDIGSVKYPRVKPGWGVDGAFVDTSTANPFPIQQIGTLNIGTVTTVSTVTALTAITNALPTGSNAIGKLAANSGVDIGDVDITSVVPGTAATNLGKAEDAAHTSGDVGVMALAVRADTITALAGTTGDYTPFQTDSLGRVRGRDMLVNSSDVEIAFNANGITTMSASAPVTVASDQSWLKGLSNRAFVATFTTLTRPANTTAYTAGDSISDSITAGSVTALSATVGDVNDDPVFVSEVLVTSTDTGLSGKRLRAYLYNADPTASTGVVGGDNAAFSNKKNGYVGSFSGRMEAGFSDGTPGRLVPSFQLSTDTTDIAGAPAGGFLVATPTSGAKTLYIQFQAIDGFTPSANSTTIIAKAKGWQARAT